jgi:dolichyl-phosphate-mannose-protein mannosyltransferase
VAEHTTARNQVSHWTIAFSASILAALVLWLGLAALSPGHVGDMRTRKARAKWLTEQGIEKAYINDRLRINWPPVNLYLFTLVGTTYRNLADASFDLDRARESQFLSWLLRVPPTLFHMATATLVFFWVRAFGSERLAWLAGTALAFNPAAIYHVAVFGQHDPVHTLFSLSAVVALSMRRSGWAGSAMALAALTKPQSWILLPLVSAGAWRFGGARGLLLCCSGAAITALICLAPFLVSNGAGDIGRFVQYLNTHSGTSRVISANAHNLWWLPTLARGSWIQDAERLLGPISYFWFGVGLVGVALAACLVYLFRTESPNLYLLAATLLAAWYFFTPRAHESHPFFILPFLAIAWAVRRRLFVWYALASVAVLANLVLADPLVVGELTLEAPLSSALPLWFMAATLADVALFAALLVGLAGELSRTEPGEETSAREGLPADKLVLWKA